jgi:hypothetical protein
MVRKTSGAGRPGSLILAVQVFVMAGRVLLLAALEAWRRRRG